MMPVVNKAPAWVNYFSVNGLIFGHAAVFAAQHLQVEQLENNYQKRTCENCPDNTAANGIEITHESPLLQAAKVVLENRLS